MKKYRSKNFIKPLFIRMIAAVLMITLLFPYFSDLMPASKTQAGGKLRLSAAKSIAAANSEKIEALEIQIEAKQAARNSAIRSIAEKQKNMSTFRWSPLLNFEFPTKPDEAEAFEFQYKPVQLQYDIDTLNHKITDEKLKSFEKVSTIYIEIITSSNEIGFLKERIKSLKIAIEKNRARVIEGTATQAQVDQQNDRLEGLENSLASEQTTLQRAKEKLGRELGFDVTSGYTFEDAFISSNMSRDCIDQLKYFAMSSADSSASYIKEENVYEAKQAEELAKLALMTNYNLMKSQYSGNIGMISGYVQQALDGSKVNKRAFKKDYDAFLKRIDDPWTGKKRILFFKFPKVWWKGEIDGIRYVEDDPYVLYSATLEYESALKDYNNARTELSNAITDGFDSYIETRKAYIKSVEDLEKLQTQLIYDEALNALGQLSLEEYEAELTEYENARTAMNDALSLYSSTLFEYDRTTCGGASAYFVEESISSQSGNSGTGNIDDDLNRLDVITKKGAIYSIRSIVENEEFMLYIDVPDGFEYNITDFELWSDGRQIGERTKKGEAIKHLTITVKEVDKVAIRLYDGEEFIDECAIDPEVSVGPLNIKEASLPENKNDSKVIGKYTVEEDTNTDMIKLRFEFDNKAVEKNYTTDKKVAYYNLSAETNLFLFSNDLVNVEDAFAYMSFIKNDLGKLTIRLFDEDGSYIGGAAFEADKKRLIADDSVTEADMQEIAAREILKKRKAEEITAERDRLQDLLNAASDVNAQEAESATMSYYRERIEELDAQLMDVADTITDDEVRKCLEEDAKEVADMVQKMSREVADEEAAAAGLNPAEIAARNTILENAAKEILKEKKKKELIDSIDASIRDKERELVTKLDQLSKGKDVSADINNLQNELDLLRSKKDMVSVDESGINNADIQEALLKYGDEIYAAAADQLSDAMLYGSETGQWAIAYLEKDGLEVNEENIRSVVEKADLLKDRENLLGRKSDLESEKAEALKKIEALKKLLNDDATSKTTDENLIKQLENLVKAYDGEIKKTDKLLLKYDPLKDVKLKTANEELEALRAKKAADESARSELLCMKTGKDAYTAAERNAAAEYDESKVKATIASIELFQNNRKKELENEIAMLQSVLDMTQEEKKQIEDMISSKESELAETEEKLANYEKMMDQLAEGIAHAGYLAKILLDMQLKMYANSYNALQQRKVELTSSINSMRESSDPDKARPQLETAKAELDALSQNIEKKKNDIYAARDKALADLALKEGEWDASAAQQQKYDENIAGYDERIKELEYMISLYY